MMTIESLIAHYGYFAVGIGTFFEGETVLVLGGFAAHQGLLELYWVIAAAFVGTLSGDQLYFYIGRIKGTQILEKRPCLKSKSEKALGLLHKYQTWFIIGFRFIYGLRTVTPFLVGASRVTPGRFLILNMIGALLWSVVFGILGYLFGTTLDIILGDLKRYELLILGLMAVAGLLIWLVLLLRKAHH